MMEEQKKTGRIPTRTRMTCLIWVAIFLAIALFARFCAMVISGVNAR